MISGAQKQNRFQRRQLFAAGTNHSLHVPVIIEIQLFQVLQVI